MNNATIHAIVKFLVKRAIDRKDVNANNDAADADTKICIAVLYILGMHFLQFLTHLVLHSGCIMPPFVKDC